MPKNILIVEDDALKSNQIMSFAKSVNNDILINRKESLNSGLLELLKNSYDLIILDMSLPTFDKNESEFFQPYGGLLFLDEVKRKKYTCPVVVVTQYATFGESSGEAEISFNEIDLECKNKYPNFKEIIYYLDESWKEKLKKYIVGEIDDKDIIC